MELNLNRSDSEENSAFDVPNLNKMKLFDVFDDPPLVSDDEEGPLKIDISNPCVDEDDESLGYDSIFKSKMVETEKIETNAESGSALNDCLHDELVLFSAEEKVIVTNEVERNDSPEKDKVDLIEKDEQAPLDFDLPVDVNEEDSESASNRVYKVSSESSTGEASGDEYRHAEVTFNDEEEMEVSSQGNIGRWTYSGGASKKAKSTASSGAKKPTSEYEKEKFAIHSESQRLIRETNLDLLHYKPKEYTSVAEFKKALYGDKTKTIQRLMPSRIPVVEATSPSKKIQVLTSHPYRKFDLPDNLPPPKLLQANDDDVIDLFQDDQPVIPGKRSQAEELISRFHKFSKPIERKDGAPITKTQEFSILTKVADVKTGTVSLKFDSVKYTSTTKQPLTFTNRREWAKHRAELKEIMRVKKLKQYEERIKEYKPLQRSEIPGDRNESEEDEDWVEDEESFSDDSSTSSESGEDEEQDEDDDEAPRVKRKPKNPFLDDEAAEGSDNPDDGSGNGSEDDNGVTANETDKFIPENQSKIRPMHNGHLEPGDVDLFAGDSITQSMHSQNRTLSDRSWNATPYSLLFSQKQSSDSATDSSSLGQTKIEPTMPTATQTQDLKTQEPIQPMTTQGELDDYSMVKVELNLTQFGSAGSKGLTGGPTQTQLIDDFEDIDPTQSLTVPLPSIDESYKPKLVRIRDVTDPSATKVSSVIRPSAQSTQLIPSNTVDLAFTQDVDFGATQTQLVPNQFADLDDTQKADAAQTQALGLTIQSPKDKPASEALTRPKLMRVRDALNGSLTNEVESLPATQELQPVELEVNAPKLELLDPSYIQCSFATQALDEPQELRPKEESHKPRKRLRHNSDDDSNGEEEVSSSSKRRALIAQSAQPLEQIEAIEDENDESSSESSAAMEVGENAEEDIEDAEDSKFEEEEGSDGETIGDENSEEEHEGDETEAEEEYSSENDEEKEYLKMVQSEIEDRKQEKKHPKFRPAEFIDEEAELSGDEEERALYRDERDEDKESEDDASSLKDFVDENEMDERRMGKLRHEVERVYNRIQEDEDQRKLRYLKEMFFEDGDLYDGEGRARKRRFRWKGLDDEDPFALGGKLVDLDAEEGDEDGSGVPSSGVSGFMSRGLLQGIVVKEVSSSDNPDATPKDGSSQVTENPSVGTSADVDSQDTFDSSESLLSALGKKVILPQRSVSLTFVSPKKRRVIDLRQKTLPAMLLKSHSTNDASPLERPTLGTKRGSLLSRPTATLLAPTRSRSLAVQSRQFSTDLDVDNNVENDPGVANRGQVDVSTSGLRTKVGLSCFSTRLNSDATPITNRSHFVKAATPQPVKTVLVCYFLTLH
ncbi:unnamed protein product [Rodentolepis nana]|uniref:Claspin n=1 Tax=Rodentolepis nana TaxID=102285 RepID=A0A0R3TLU2_RODNA|nr:unnamed protein product [Rodentolepis nana]